MSHFLRLLTEVANKQQILADVCTQVRNGVPDQRHFEVNAKSFEQLPGKPFAYWVSETVRSLFSKAPAFEGNGRQAQHGGSTKDDFRFLRAGWEVFGSQSAWVNFAKGGAFSRFYSDVHLKVNWRDDARELEAALLHKYPYLGESANWVLHRECNYLRPGVTWPSRTQAGLSMRALPAGCIFASRGPSAFVPDDDPAALLALLAVANSSSFALLVSLQMSFGSYEVGVIQRTPFRDLRAEQQARLASLARRAWSQKRTLDTIEETSHAFILPAALRGRLGKFDPPASEAELIRIQTEIDEIAFDLYGFAQPDRMALEQPMKGDAGDDEDNSTESEIEDEDENEDSAIESPADTQPALLSWAVGVAFGRFDWRLATGERKPPPEPGPFDPLPAKSQGMLPDGAKSFHVHAGVLVDDQGHPHDLTRLIEEVLARVDVSVPDEVRRWLQRDFFAFHLQRYSKSRRKAPIYWPLSTMSGGYTLWIYYPTLTSQTLYTAINDFVEPKLGQVRAGVTALRNKGIARTRDDEKQFEAVQTFELELIELRDTLLKLAPTYEPNHDDGVQLTAAPLWPLFRHKPWQKLLKQTWTKLENAVYDWAHLAMNYWPTRVREKCISDKSLAIAHGLEDLYIEPKAKPKKARGKKKSGSVE